MQRRRLLAGLAAGVPLAGCLGASSPGTPSTETATTETATTTTADETTAATTSTAGTTSAGDAETLDLGESFDTSDGRTVTVRAVRVRRFVLTWGVHVDPVALAGRQFVVADVSVESGNAGTTATPAYPGGDNLRQQFRVGLDGERYPETDRVFRVLPRSDDPDRVRLGFPVPAPATADRGAVVWTGGSDVPAARWTLTDDHRRALANPPAFEVRAFEIPDEVERGTEFEATVTVANTGSSNGTFLAELGATTISDTPEIRVDVPAGQTVTARRTVDPYYPEDAAELTVVLNWGVDRLRRTASVVD